MLFSSHFAFLIAERFLPARLDRLSSESFDIPVALCFFFICLPGFV
jgi:hypothetical protein